MKSLGQKSVCIANNTHNEFSNVVNMIMGIRQEMILPNEKFLVKVELYVGGLQSLGYKEKDIEFAASRQLAAELSGRGARPAKSKDIVDNSRARDPPSSLNGSTEAILLENIHYKMLTLLPQML